MLSFKNHQFDFCCASGALGFDGDGYWFEQPWRWLGLLRPEEMTIITKTLTYAPREGNLKMWCPWRCVKLIPNGMANAVGLTNPGLSWWLNNVCDRLKYNAIVSIMPNTTLEVEKMIECINKKSQSKLVGIQINPHCPNVTNTATIDEMCKMVVSCAEQSKLPVTVKLSYTSPYVEICRKLDGKVAAIELINSVQWDVVFPNKRFPFRKYGIKGGGVSGEIIKPYARQALSEVRKAGVKTPIISGGGIDSYKEAEKRFVLGAAAVAFGSVFMRTPWKPNQIIRKWREKHDKRPFGL